MSIALLHLALAPVEQDHLLQARQMQALSFAVHIPLVCFGISFPALVLFAEWRYHRSGDALWYILARDRQGRLYKGMGLIETEADVQPAPAAAR